MNYPDFKKEELNVFSCSNCGAELKYQPGTKTLICEYCDSKNEIHEEKTIIEELDFEKYIENLEAENLESEKIISCKSCSSSSVVDESLKSFHCPYCSAPLVQDDISEERFIKPSYLLPFNIEDEKITSLLSGWTNRLWFAPNNLKKAALSPIGLKGVYVPYWTFDVNTSSSYTGERGENYTVTVGSGNSQRTETRTRWHYTSGHVYLSFDDLIIPASGNISQKSLMELEPWNTSELVKANDQYLSGFITEKYKIKLKEGFQTAKIEIDDQIRSEIKSDIGGDDQRISSVNTQYNNIKFKHILLPVYVSSYRYNNKIYNFYVNGRSGKLVGQRPYSIIKIALAIIAAILLFLLVFYYHSQNQ